LQFTRRADGNTFFMRPQTKIGAHKQFKFDIMAMALPGDPGQLQVKLIGVQFDDLSAWGSYRKLPLESTSTAVNVTVHTIPEGAESHEGGPGDGIPNDGKQNVDRRPVAMNTIRVFYTEEGRNHWVNGVVHLRVLVNAEGNVGVIKVLNVLPEWLTEETIRVVRRISFLPAIKNNEPVPCWIPLQVNFSLF
jgi:hypothetical protein